MQNKTIAQLCVMVFLLAGFLSIEAQVPGMPFMSLKEIIRKNVFGGTGSDGGYCIIQTTDGGYAIAGITNSNDGDVSGNHGGSDMWVVKFNATGSIEWKKTFGGTGYDGAYSIIQTSDDGYAIAGSIYVSNAYGNMFVAKLSASGSLEWQKSLGGTDNDGANSIIQTSDGGYAVAGFTYSTDAGFSEPAGSWDGSSYGSDIYIVKLNSAGTVEWSRHYGGSGNDAASSIIQATDGDYVVAGVSQSGSYTGYYYNNYNSGNHGGGDMWVIKLKSSGGVEWERTLGGTVNDEANSIIRTADGGYIVAGGAASNDGDVSGNHGNRDAWVIKLSNLGIIQWQKLLGGSINDLANSIIQTADGGYAAAGFTFSNDGDVSGNHGGGDMWVVKLNTAGTIQWQKALGGTGFDRAQSIIRTSNGGYAIVGVTDSIDGNIIGPNNGSSDVFLLRLDAAGNFIRVYEDAPE
ncbi:T9SS C-terminal target domain-containing protein [uncultured Chryseobacterium sp.]|uniref:T9SS C-terminal target domain-containing protein n=1 Tax=uncultured Chryseobacterium sp. TaxID=259322 RepID=UPI0025FEC913|nr:T9SS C-terminal target domain-containing protein [uncultured Chryseobacterium sp.]